MLSLKPGDLFAEHYKLVRLVDTGGFAEVWEAIFIKAGNTIALKIFPKLDAEGVKNIEAEYRNQTDLLHTNLVIARNFGIYEGQPYLEMLFFNGGNGSSKIGKCDEAEIARCLSQIASGLTYLHAKEIIHQDIKPNNFLLDRDGNYYLADLGLSVKIRQTIQRYTETQNIQSSSVPKNTTGLTPPCYRAPELYERPSSPKPPVKATDIWSLGASAFEMANGDVPFGDMGGMLQMHNPEPPDLPSSFSYELNSIIKRCLTKDAWERPKASELAEWSENYIRRGYWITPPVPLSPIPTLPPPAKSSRMRKVIYFLVGLLLVAGIVWGISNFKGTSKSTADTPKKDSIQRDTSAGIHEGTKGSAGTDERVVKPKPKKPLVLTPGSPVVDTLRKGKRQKNKEDPFLEKDPEQKNQ
jgi:serine/threonine protein kinase